MRSCGAEEARMEGVVCQGVAEQIEKVSKKGEGDVAESVDRFGGGGVCRAAVACG